MIIDLADKSMQVWDTRDDAARQADRDTRHAALPSAKAYVQKLLAGDTPTRTLMGVVRHDTSLSTLQKLLALDQLWPEIDRIDHEADKQFTWIVDGTGDKSQLAGRLAEIPDKRVRQVTQEKLAKWKPEVAELSDQAWNIAIRSDASPEQYAEALKMATQAAAIEENTFSLNALGTALYRVGEYDAAVKALLQADKLWVAAGHPPGEYNWGFIAMAYQKQTRHEEAKAALAKLKTTGHQGDLGTKLRAEAAALISPPSTRSATTQPQDSPWR